MNFVGGYGSDSDGDVAASVVAPVHKVPTPAPLLNNKPAAVQRKVKRLDISFLPPEIQAALARGDSTNDSDDDVESSGTRSHSAGVPKLSADSGNGNDNKSKLLGMLPAPKAKEEPKLVSTEKKETVPATANSKAAVEGAAPKSAFVFGFTSTATSRVTKKTAVEDIATQGKVNTSTADADSDNDNETPVLPWMQSSKTKAVAEVLYDLQSKLYYVKLSTSKLFLLCFISGSSHPIRSCPAHS